MDIYYTKLFHRILSSSIWEEDDKTRLVWITLMASTDSKGAVIGTMAKLARDARVDIEACQMAIEKFLSPDFTSLTSAHEGRRIEAIEGGWRLLNHEKYKLMMDEERKREYFRNKRREYRDKARAHHRGQTIKEVVGDKLAAENQLNEIN